MFGLLGVGADKGLDAGMEVEHFVLTFGSAHYPAYRLGGVLGAGKDSPQFSGGNYVTKSQPSADQGIGILGRLVGERLIIIFSDRRLGKSRGKRGLGRRLGTVGKTMTEMHQ